MTTLPQTTPTRLPRPSGGPLTLNTAVQPVGGAPGGMTPADIYRLLRANGWIILGSVVIALILGYGVNWFLALKFSRYTAVGSVQVVPAVAYDPLTRQTIPLADFSTLSVEQRTIALMLYSEGMFSMVLGKLDDPIRDTDWFRGFVNKEVSGDGTVHEVTDTARARKSLLDNFTAAPIAETKLVRVSMTGPNPKDCKTIVESVVNQAIDAQLSNIAEHTTERSSSLNQIRDKRQTDIARLEANQHDLVNKLGIDAGGVAGRFTSRDAELTKLIETRIDIETRAAAAKADFENISSQVAKGNDPPQVEAQIAVDSTVNQYKERVDDLDIELDAQIALQPNSTQVRELRARRDATARKLEELRDEARVTARSALVAGLQANLDSTSQQYEKVKQQIEELKGTLQSLSIDMQTYLGAEDKLRLLNEDLKQVQDQIDMILAQSVQGSNTVSWYQRPEVPDEPSFPKLWMTLSMSALLGLAISLGITFVRELMDTTIRSPRDIARIGTLNLLGMIPHEDDDPQSAGSPLPTVIFQAPASIIAEHYRQLRTRLQHAASLDSTRSLMVTSPGPGDGKTTVACNVAAGLALNGRRILLVDANFRRPELHNIFGVDCTTGLSTVLGALENFDSAVHHTPVPNLDVLPTGPRPANPTELLESQLLHDFIDRALEEYDHVIFDTGPLLLVSETAALAPRVDGVVIVVRARASQRGLLQRMSETLRQLKAEQLGVVLNGVRSQGGGYYGRNIRTYYEYQSDRVA
jgi:polysaccharide biosynthesis transport protein